MIGKPQSSDMGDMVSEELGHTLVDTLAGEQVDPFAQPEGGVQVAGLAQNLSRLLKPRTAQIIRNRKARGAGADGPTREQLERTLTTMEQEAAAREGKVVDPNDLAGEPHATPVDPTVDAPPSERVDAAASQRIIQKADTERLLHDFQQTGPVESKYTSSGLNVRRHHEGARANADLNSMPPDVALERMQTAEDVGRLLEAVGKQDDMSRGVRTHEEVTARTGTLAQIRTELSDVFSGRQVGLLSDTQLMAGRRMLATLGEDVTRLADEISNGSRQPATMLEYQRKGEALVALQRYMQGQVTEVARALSQQRAIAQTLRAGSGEDIAALIGAEGGTAEEIVRHAKVTKYRNEVAANKNANAIEELTRALKAEGRSDAEIKVEIDNLQSKQALDTMQRTWDTKRRMGVGLAVEYWKAQILSGLGTDIINITSNGVVNAWENAIIRPLAGTVGAVRTGGAKGVDRVYLAESMPALVSSYAGIRDGFTALYHVMKTMETDFGGGGKADRTGAMEKAGAALERFGPVAGAAGRGTADVLGLPFRMLQAEDDLFKTLNFRQELTSLAVRHAYAQGLSGDAALKEAARLVEEPTDMMYEAAMEHAKRTTFTNEDIGGLSGVMAKAIKTATAAVPELKFIAPFVTTPSNIVAYAVETSALAPLSGRLQQMIVRGGAERDVAIAKVVAGVGFTLSMYQLYQAGLITGAGPKNYQQKKQLAKTGRPTQVSIKTPEGYMRINRLDPFAASIAGLVNKLDEAKYSGREEDFQDLMLSASFGVADHMLNSTYMKSVGDLLSVIEGRYPAARFFANYAAGFVPFSSALKDVSQVVDPQPRAVFDDKEFQTGFGHQLQGMVSKTIPGKSRYLPPQRHWDGSPVVPDQGRVAYAISPIELTKEHPGTAADHELIRQGVAPRHPSPIITMGAGTASVHISLLDMDGGKGNFYDAYIQRVGQIRKDLVNEVVSEPGYDELTEGKYGERYNQLSRVIAMARKVGYAEFLEQDLPRLIREYPDDVENYAHMLQMDPDAFVDMALSGAWKETDVKPGRGVGAKPLPLPPHLEGAERPPAMPRI